MEFDIDDELPDRESGKRIDLIFRINEKKRNLSMLSSTILSKI